MKDFLTLSKERYSCRDFSSKKVPEELVEKIKECALAAPTAVNRQPWKVWVVSSEEALSRIAPTTRSNYGAPLIFVVGVDSSKAWVRGFDGKNGAEIDGAIVATHILLEAQDLGLASVWVASFDPALLSEVLPGSDSYHPVAMIYVGYPGEKAAPSPMHGTRKDPSEVFEDL